MHIKWPRSSQDKFFSILNEADEIIDVSPDPFSREKMMCRNVWMVDNSSLVVAVWKGHSSGTENCVNYARSQNKDIIFLNSAYRRV